jgi:flagellar hook-associated protein 1 FlgK
MGLLSIGINGLTTSQTALQVTGNNIANANVPGYSRQRVETVTRQEQFTGAGYLGAGALITDISRIVDPFLITQLQLDTAAFNLFDVQSSNLNQLDALLSGDLSGLNSAIGDFFAAIEASAQDPTSAPARQVVVSEAEGLTQRFNTLYDRVSQQLDSINSQLDSQARQLSTLAAGVAELNQAIAEAIGVGQGSQPNQLLDERDALLLEMSKIVTVTTVSQSDGMLNVFIGAGQPLVVGTNASQLDTRASTSTPGNVDIVFIGDSSVQNITQAISGGTMGGLLETRDNELSNVLNSLGRIALGLTDTLNQQNRLGVDLEGNLGGDIFVDINASPQTTQRVIIDSGNANSAAQQIAVTIDEVGQLTTSDYVLTIFDGDGDADVDYRLVRKSDNTVVASGELVAGGQSGSITVDGFTIDIDALSADLEFGDQFYIQPTRNGAANVAMDLQRLQELAYGAPVVTLSSRGNSGNGIVSPGTMIEMLDGAGETFDPTAIAAGEINPPILIHFTSATDYNVLDNTDPTSPTILFSGTMIPGQQNDVFLSSATDTTPAGASYVGYQIQLSGSPAAGDEFTISFNQNGSGDNRNAVLLGQIRTDEILDSGSTNFENSYGNLIEELGTRTAQLRVSRDASKSLLAQSQSNRDALSGVSLDEEAANLIKFEQTYNAAAQMINIARQLFNTLIGVF